MTDELEPCPFCSGKASLSKDGQAWRMRAMGDPHVEDDFRFRVHHRCPSGLVTSIHFVTKAAAIAAWNTRAQQGQVTDADRAAQERAEITRLREALERIAKGCDGRIDRDSIPALIAADAIARTGDAP